MWQTRSAQCFNLETLSSKNSSSFLTSLYSISHNNEFIEQIYQLKEKILFPWKQKNNSAETEQKLSRDYLKVKHQPLYTLQKIATIFTVKKELNCKS